MPPKVMQTSRKVRNSEIGIDISVPSHEVASAAKLVKSYHVVVITSLPYFKDATHDEEQTVQFMVLKDYEAFERLQKEMLESFPHLKLPNLPRKYHFFMSDADIEERQIAFDCLLKVLCRDKVMCTSPILLRFLGFSHDADVVYFKKRAEYLNSIEHRKTEEQSDPETHTFDVAGRVDTLSPGDGSTTNAAQNTDISVRTGRKPFALEDLFVPDDESEVAEVAEHSELLSVTDEVDDILPTVIPTVPSERHNVSEVTSTDVSENIESTHMESGDIVAYIDSNTAESEDLDIF